MRALAVMSRSSLRRCRSLVVRRGFGLVGDVDRPKAPKTAVVPSSSLELLGSGITRKHGSSRRTCSPSSGNTTRTS